MSSLADGVVQGLLDEVDDDMPTSVFRQPARGAVPPDCRGNLTFSPEDVRPLYAVSPPRRDLQREKAWHRTAAYLFAKGSTVKEIGEALDKTRSSVSLLVQQPFFRELVATITREYALEDEGALGILRNAGSNAAATIVSLATNAKSEAVRLQASKSIMDRLFGQAAQIIRNEGSVPVDPAKEKAKLEEEIKRLANRVPVQVNIQNNLTPHE